MDCTASRFETETPAPTKTNRQVRRAKRSKAIAVPKLTDEARRAEFEALSASIREELHPAGAIETIYVERAIVAAWRLREAVEAERAGVVGGLTIGGDSSDLFGGITERLRRESDRAERSLRRVLDSLNDLRDAAKSRWGHAVYPASAVIESEPEPEPEPETIVDADLSNEWPILPVEEIESPEPVDVDEAPLPHWQDRLVFDFNVSNESPVVRGTWITVAQIVTLIVDGQTWADILRSHPELTEEDIRFCLSYATEQENDGSRGIYLP